MNKAPWDYWVFPPFPGLRRTRQAYVNDMRERDRDILANFRMLRAKERRFDGLLAFTVGAALGIVSTALGFWYA